MTEGKDMLVDLIESLKSSSDISFDDNSKGKVLGLVKFVISSDYSLKSPIIPQQNGVAERKNRTLIKMARKMLDEYKSAYKLWAEAINTACHASNRLYLHKLKNKIPYEFLTGKKPNVKYFRVFGCK